MAELSVPPGDWDDMRIDNAAVKIWIPASLDVCLADLSVRFEQSKSDLARNGLMVHLYGRYVFEQLVANRIWKLSRRLEQEDNVKYSMEGIRIKLEDAPRPAFIQAFGKNNEDLKVWMPKRLKDSIEGLAIEAGQTLSEYMRRALTAYYMGRTVMDPLRG